MKEDLHAEGATSEEDTQRDRYLTFRIGEEDYGIEIRHVIEIVGMQRITEVPDMPGYVKGVINLRGQVIPVIDVRSRFHIESRAYDDRTCLIVARIQEVSIGLIVDTVSEVRYIPPEAVTPPPEIARGSASRFVRGLGKVGDEVKILLEADRLLFDGEVDRLAAAAA